MKPSRNRMKMPLRLLPLSSPDLVFCRIFFMIRLLKFVVQTSPDSEGMCTSAEVTR